MTHTLTRFMSYVEVMPSGCWYWRGGLNVGGYGKFHWFGRTVAAHRAAYLLMQDEIPVGHTLDHLCRVRRCVNPTHLEPTTMRVNILRGQGWAAKNARKRRCKRGHLYTTWNTLKQKRGRCCRKCRRMDWVRYRQRQKELR